MICKYCGETISENSKFCLNCGHKVSMESSIPVADSAFMKNESPSSEGIFCGYCGTKNQDGRAFCEKCGAQLSNSVLRPDSAKMKRKAHKRNRIVGISIVAIIAVVCIAIIIGIFGGRSYKSTIDKYIKASYEADGKAMLSLMPKKIIAVGCEEEEMTERELAKEITQSLEDQLDYYNRNYDEWSYSYEIKKVKDITGKKLKEIKEDFEDEYDIKVKAAKTATVDITLILDGDTVSKEVSVQLIKVGNSWYVSGV